MKPEDRIWVALDTPDRERALSLARTLAGRVGGFKVGLEAFVACGPSLVRELSGLGHRIFLDLKLHDIPNTVAGAAAGAARLGVAMFTVHSLGGPEMIARAASASREAAPPGAAPPIVLAVTILTSHDDAGLTRIGIAGPCEPAVSRLAAMAREAGAGGAVCSPLEVGVARSAFPSGLLVVPGIRGVTEGPKADDQARVATPSATIRSGADALVVGRPITQSADPAAAAAAIADDIRRNADR